MITTQNQLNAAQKQVYESMISYTNSALDFAEKMANLHLSFAKESGDASAEHGKKLMEAKDVQELVQTQTNALQPHFEHMINYSKKFMELSSDAQEEITKSAEEQLSEINRVVVDALERTAKNGPAGSEVAVAAVKSVFVASTAAYDSINKAAKKVSEVAATNLNAASQAGIKAAASSASKKK